MIKKTIVLAVALLLLSSCRTTGSQLPSVSDTEERMGDQCDLPEGIEIVSIQLNEDQTGEISGPTAFNMTVELNREINTGEFVPVCYAIRDVDRLNPNNFLAVSLVGSGFSGESEFTRTFNLSCDANGEVVGVDRYFMDPTSSNERNTKVYVQHIESLRASGDKMIGIRGIKSNEIRVICAEQN